MQGLKGAVQELIKAYRTANGCPPKALVFYRDGVSEGQFAEVERVELPLIRAACLEVHSLESKHGQIPGCNRDCLSHLPCLISEGTHQ